eukprot:gene20257-24257_t
MEPRGEGEAAAAPLTRSRGSAPKLKEWDTERGSGIEACTSPVEESLKERERATSTSRKRLASAVDVEASECEPSTANVTTGKAAEASRRKPPATSKQRAAETVARNARERRASTAIEAANHCEAVVHQRDKERMTSLRNVPARAASAACEAQLASSMRPKSSPSAKPARALPAKAAGDRPVKGSADPAKPAGAPPAEGTTAPAKPAGGPAVNAADPPVKPAGAPLAKAAAVSAKPTQCSVGKAGARKAQATSAPAKPAQGQLPIGVDAVAKVKASPAVKTGASTAGSPAGTPAKRNGASTPAKLAATLTKRRAFPAPVVAAVAEPSPNSMAQRNAFEAAAPGKTGTAEAAEPAIKGPGKATQESALSGETLQPLHPDAARRLLTHKLKEATGSATKGNGMAAGITDGSAGLPEAARLEGLQGAVPHTPQAVGNGPAAALQGGQGFQLPRFSMNWDYCESGPALPDPQLGTVVHIGCVPMGRQGEDVLLRAMSGAEGLGLRFAAEAGRGELWSSGAGGGVKVALDTHAQSTVLTLCELGPSIDRSGMWLAMRMTKEMKQAEDVRLLTQ